jgi:hypothetical protein
MIRSRPYHLLIHNTPYIGSRHTYKKKKVDRRYGIYLHYTISPPLPANSNHAQELYHVRRATSPDLQPSTAGMSALYCSKASSGAKTGRSSKKICKLEQGAWRHAGANAWTEGPISMNERFERDPSLDEDGRQVIYQTL